MTSNRIRPTFTKTLLSTVIALAAAPTLAQEGGTLEEVVVTAQFQRNLDNALDTKRPRSMCRLLRSSPIDRDKPDNAGSHEATRLGVCRSRYPSPSA